MSQFIIAALIAYGAGYVAGQLTHNLRTWKILLLIVFSAPIYIAIMSLQGASFYFFLAGVLSHHTWHFVRVWSWAGDLMSGYRALRYRSAYEGSVPAGGRMTP